jgi:hypothetical protein
MRKILACLLAAAMLLSLAACGGIKEAVQEKTRELIGNATGQTKPADGTKTGGSSGESGTAPGGGSRPIADADSPGGYWDRLESEWENAPEDGYVWTITIKSDETLTIPMELGSVNYKLDLSCSHVGKDMFGVYKGSMAMSYAADLDNMVELLTMTGGSADYDADGWFKNDAFIMEMGDYDYDAEYYFKEMLEPESELTAEEQAIADAYMGSILGDTGSGVKEFETMETPAGNWFDWDFHMTEGDMSGYLNVTGIAYGTTSGSGTVDASGKAMQGWATASHPLAGTFSDRYNETLEYPFPYVIRLYETGEAVFELYSANGGPVTVKFYGTVDKIPVEQTTLVKP